MLETQASAQDSNLSLSGLASARSDRLAHLDAWIMEHRSSGGDASPSRNSEAIALGYAAKLGLKIKHEHNNDALFLGLNSRWTRDELVNRYGVVEDGLAQSNIQMMPEEIQGLLQQWARAASAAYSRLLYRIPPSMKSDDLPLSPGAALSENAVERRAQVALLQCVKGVKLPKVTDAVAAKPDSQIILHQLSESAREHFVHRAQLDAQVWIRSDKARRLEKVRRDAIGAKLMEWHEKRQTAKEEEEVCQIALAEQKERAKRQEIQRWRDYGKHLREKVGQWQDKRAGEREEEKPSPLKPVVGKDLLRPGLKNARVKNDDVTTLG